MGIWVQLETNTCGFRKVFSSKLWYRKYICYIGGPCIQCISYISSFFCPRSKLWFDYGPFDPSSLLYLVSPFLSCFHIGKLYWDWQLLFEFQDPVCEKKKYSIHFRCRCFFFLYQTNSFFPPINPKYDKQCFVDSTTLCAVDVSIDGLSM